MQRLQQAEALKQEGNQLYIQGDLQEALVGPSGPCSHV